MIILHDSKHASVDASDLSLAPGDFPKFLTVEVPGRGATPFVRCGQIISRRQTAGFEYEAPDGLNLVVHND
jgi:hypothetical protein